MDGVGSLGAGESAVELPAHEVSQDTRQVVDRRSRHTPIFSRYWLRGRRRGGRRDGETAGIYVDRYTRAETMLSIWLVVGALLDLVLTIVHLRAGGAEANPIMDWFLQQGGEPAFVAAKVFAALPATLFLLLHVRFRGAFVGLVGLGVMYMALVAYHVLAAVDRGAFS